VSPDGRDVQAGLTDRMVYKRHMGGVLVYLTQWVPDPVSSGVKRSEGDHSPPSTGEIKNSRDITSLPHKSSWHNA
jgi:hypothetical protein